MTTPELALTWLTENAESSAPLLAVGPSLGTTVTTLWAAVAERLDGSYRILGWDLPGHGGSASATGFTVADLAAAVLAAVKEETFAYAGDSLGGAVGLQLMLEAPDRVSSATVLCTGPRIGTPESWHERAAAVRSHGTAVLLDAQPSLWFAPGFVERAPSVARALLADLAEADTESYAACCEALAAWDLRSRLADIRRPVLAVAGDCDVVAPPERLRHIAEGVPNGRLEVLTGVGHLAPVEAADAVAALLTSPIKPSAGPLVEDVRAAGMRVRREVLGDAHVDRAQAGVDELTAEFQDLITSYAWGSIWTRPGLDRRSRSIITLTALIARGHEAELAMHLRAALTNGLTRDEVKEVLLQTAIYCGVPDANTAFRIASQVFDEKSHPDDRSSE